MASMVSDNDLREGAGVSVALRIIAYAPEIRTHIEEAFIEPHRSL